MTGPETRSPLDAARELAPEDPRRRRRDRGRARAAARRSSRRSPTPGSSTWRSPRSVGGARARPADLHPGDRGARQGGREHRLDGQPGRDLRDLRGADAARRRARDLDRHAARRRREHAGRDGHRRRGARRLPRHRPPGLQHRLPARVLARRARPGDRERPDAARAATASRRRATSSCPCGEAELLDTWHVRGMRGTGTHHFAVNDVFVPAERTVLSVTAPLVETGAALPDPAHARVRLGRCRRWRSAGAHVPRDVLRARGRQDPARDAGPAARSADGPGGRRARRGAPALRPRLPDRDGARPLERARATTGTLTLDQRAALRIATTHGIRLAVQVIDTRLQRRRRHRGLREPPHPAPLPGHPRDQPAHAGAPRPLRARRPALAGPPHRRSPPVEFATGGR